MSESDPTTQHVRAAIAGDTRSLDWLIQRFTPWLSAQARYRLQGALARHCEPDDLVQEVWAVAIVRLPRLPHDDRRATPALMQFLATTLLHKVHNLLRKRAALQLPEVAETAEVDFAAETATAVTRAVVAERRDLVGNVLATMNEAHREILILRGIEGHAYEDLEKLLGVPAATLRMRFLRAGERLRDRLPNELVFDLD